ncbi:MAG: hypothetical protein WCK90_04115 [archaeon]
MEWSEEDRKRRLAQTKIINRYVMDKLRDDRAVRANWVRIIELEPYLFEHEFHAAVEFDRSFRTREGLFGKTIEGGIVERAFEIETARNGDSPEARCKINPIYCKTIVAALKEYSQNQSKDSQLIIRRYMMPLTRGKRIETLGPGRSIYVSLPEFHALL